MNINEFPGESPSISADLMEYKKKGNIFSFNNIQTRFQKSWDTVQIVNKNRMQ